LNLQQSAASCSPGALYVARKTPRDRASGYADEGGGRAGMTAAMNLRATTDE
jgi:hypothetical protein